MRKQKKITVSTFLYGVIHNISFSFIKAKLSIHRVQKNLSYVCYILRLLNGVYYLIIYRNWYSRWACPYIAVYIIFRMLFYLHVCTFNNTFTGISSFLGYHYFWIWRLETNTLTHTHIFTHKHTFICIVLKLLLLIYT